MRSVLFGSDLFRRRRRRRRSYLPNVSTRLWLKGSSVSLLVVSVVQSFAGVVADDWFGVARLYPSAVAVAVAAKLM